MPARGLVGEPPDHDQVLPTGEVLVDGGVLAGEADALAHLVGLPDDVEPEDRGATGVGLEDRGEDADGGGLAGAVGAEQSEDGAGGHGEVDAVEGVHVAEVLHQTLGEDGGLFHAATRRADA